MELPFSLDSIGESVNDLSFSDVMYLSTQFTKLSLKVSETFTTFLLESFSFCLSDRVCDGACKIFTKSSLQILPAPDRSGA
jgi:hypothetical protein